MKFKDIISSGLRNLFRRKARTALTVIGVIIGTISIVIMVSIGIGMNESFQKGVTENGSLTVITVSTWSDTFDKDGNWIDSKTQTLDEKLVEKLRQLKHVESVAPKIEKFLQLKSGKYLSYMQLMAIDRTAFENFGFPNLTKGEYPTSEKYKILILPAQLLQSEFYNPESRSNNTKTVDWNRDKITFTFSDYQPNPNKREFNYLIQDYAVMEESNNWQYNSYTYIDMEFFKELYTQYANTLKLEERKKALASLSTYNEIQINVDNMDNVTKVQEEITKLGYGSSSDMQYIEPMQETRDMLQLVLGAIGGIALLVSAINIANTMIMAIYERTREIGIMKVLGCRIRDIRMMFLFEAGMLGLLGGIVGIVLSYVASALINKFGGSLFEALMSTGGMYGDVGEGALSVIPIWLPFAAAAIGMIVGILAGFFPAVRATRISAIEAMKTEG